MASGFRLIFAAAASVSLCACATSLTFEPSKAGAEHECATNSPHLADYNACMERVDASFREYELQRKIEDEEEG